MWNPFKNKKMPGNAANDRAKQLESARKRSENRLAQPAEKLEKLDPKSYDIGDEDSRNRLFLDIRKLNRVKRNFFTKYFVESLRLAATKSECRSFKYVFDGVNIGTEFITDKKTGEVKHQTMVHDDIKHEHSIAANLAGNMTFDTNENDFKFDADSELMGTTGTSSEIHKKDLVAFANKLDEMFERFFEGPPPFIFNHSTKSVRYIDQE